MKTKFILLLMISAMCIWAGDRSPAPTTGAGSRAWTPRKTDRPVYSKLTFVPGFAGCSFYFPAADGKAIEVAFREAGKGEYKDVLTPSYNRREKLWRGSIVNLKENTSYEVKISSEGKVVAEGKFITKGALPKIAKTIVLSEKNFKDGTLTITAKGKPDGWIRYTCAPGFVLKNDRTKPLIVINKAKYIVLDKLVLNGGGHIAVEVNYASNIRITNCDLSGWGRPDAKQYFDYVLGGKPGYIDANGKQRSTNYSAGIALNYGDNILIEKCYIHDPAGHANSWRYSHPAGPCAIFAVCPTSTTVRYNDLVANDLGRWNDAVEGLYNFGEDGGFNRDAEIYGNFMIFCQDDNIELDGGQQNVRCFGNRFESSYCGVSIQGCMSGPCYVFGNMFISMGDQYGYHGQNIKTSTNGSGVDAVAYVLNNSFTGPGTGFSMNRLLKAVVMNNAYDTSYVSGAKVMKYQKSVSDYNVMPKVKDAVPGKNGKLVAPGYANAKQGVLEPKADSPLVKAGKVIPNFTPEKDVNIGAFQKGTILPLRPMPVKTSVNKLNFKVANKKSAPQSFKVKVCGKNYSSPFAVTKSATCDWFDVVPASGVFESGKEIEFTVTLKPELMDKKTVYRGAFLLRQPNGLSRPVSIYADTDFVQKARLHNDGNKTIYINAEDFISGDGKVEVINDKNADGGKAVRLYEAKKGGKPFVYEFTVPADGKYHLMLRSRSGHRPRVRVSMDGGKMYDSALALMNYWAWAIAMDGSAKKTPNPWSWKVGYFTLKAGKHKLNIMPYGFKDIDLIALTSDPGPFEPR